jgi:oligopeptide/dipeptide ABC transporter ATP-binding protein
MTYPSSNKEIISRIRNLSVTYKTRIGPVSAVDNVSFDINRGEILGLVGESGCGKSTLGKALMRMIAPPGEVQGQHFFNNEDVMTYDDKQMRDFRGRCVSMIFQDPMTSLNPVQRIDHHLVEAIQVHEPKTTKISALDRTRTLIEQLGIQKRRLFDYPHQLSGGMRQRVMIGLGLVLNAYLIIADEATTSLDVIVEAKLVDQMKDIRDEFGVSILIITHNIALVAQIADRLAVMYAGRIVELGSIYDVFDDPKHPYTRGLLQSIPTIKLHERDELYKMPGEPPNLTHPPSGCRFHPRCSEVMPICSRIQPDLVQLEDTDRLVDCWLYQDHSEKQAQTVGVPQ